MTQKEALDTIGYIKFVLDLQGLYASVQKIHGEYQIVIRKGNVYKDPETVGTNSRIGKTVKEVRK